MRACAVTLAPEITGNEASYLKKLLKRESFRGKHLEIGTAAGGTLCLLMNVFETGARPPFVVVDSMNYFSDQFSSVQKNLENNGIPPADVEFRVQSSDEAFAEAYVRQEKFDFMLIDASHKIHHVTDDLRWTRLLNKGGIVCVHDYRHARGVTLAVDRFLRKNPHFEMLACVDKLISFRKTDGGSREEVTSGDRLWAAVLAPAIQVEASLRKRFPGTAKVKR